MRRRRRRALGRAARGGGGAAADIEEQGLGWKNKCGKGHSEDTVTSGLEGAWTVTPTQWSINYLQNLFTFEWEQTRSPAGAIQWIPKDGAASNLVPDAHVADKRHAPIMFTTDLSLKFDPSYREISQRFLNNPAEFELAFAKAWFKLTHRDMGPRARYVGSDIPAEVLTWQDPIPTVDHALVGTRDIKNLKAAVLDSGLSNAQLVRTAWSSAASYRGTDMRGGANGARIQLAPMKDWAANSPAELAEVIATLSGIQQAFNERARGGKAISMADLIVLAGAAGIEQAAIDAGNKIKVPFTPGRADATQKQTDVLSFAVLEPQADGFRNYYADGGYLQPTAAMVDRANLLGLTVPEMTALVGGLRVLDANVDGIKHGVFTANPGQLDNAYFVNLLDMATVWKPSAESAATYEGIDRQSGELKWTATPVDLMFGSSSELRAIAEVYAQAGGEAKFMTDFVSAWQKVMTADRFDLN